MLQPIKCKNTVETAIESIGTYIAYNLHPGDVLPIERDLSTQLQISRNITREALQYFRTLGIIDSKPKVGAVDARTALPGGMFMKVICRLFPRRATISVILPICG